MYIHAFMYNAADASCITRLFCVCGVFKCVFGVWAVQRQRIERAWWISKKRKCPFAMENRLIDFCLGVLDIMALSLRVEELFQSLLNSGGIIWKWVYPCWYHCVLYRSMGFKFHFIYISFPPSMFWVNESSVLVNRHSDVLLKWRVVVFI